MTSTGLPVLIIVDGSVAVTGALMAAARQAALLHDVAKTILILPNGHRVPVERTAAFAEVIELPIAGLRKSAGSLALYGPALLGASIRLNRLMKSCRCERLQLNDFYLLHGSVLRLLGYRGRIVTWARMDPRRLGVAGRFWLRMAELSSDRLVAVSRFIERLLPDRADPEMLYDPAPEVAQVTPTGETFLFIGNYIEGKGQDMAIAAFHVIAEDFPDARLHFHGGTMGLAKNLAYKTRLQRLADNGAGAGRIRLKDFASDLGLAHKGCLAALSCSASESFSLTCQDASARGLAVIATRSGGPEEIIDDGVSGFLVDCGDTYALADRMRRLLVDPALARTMGAAGAQLMRERFGTKRFVEGVSQLLALSPRT